MLKQLRVPEGLSLELRADRFITDNLGLFSRSQIKRHLVRLLINGKEAKLSKRIQSGDILEFEYRDLPPPELVPEEIELDILYENADVLVLNKPQGLVVHPGSGNRSGTLAHGLLYYCSQIGREFEDEPVRPGIVHRLDKDTSGVMIAAKNVPAQEFLAAQFRSRQVRKQYLAVVKGRPPKAKGRVEMRIARDAHHRQRFTTSAVRGKTAVTYYRTIRTYSDCTLLSLQPKTGRTHQLRVHMLHLGCPVLGDPLYNRKDFLSGSLMLHAYRLKILLPGAELPRVFKAPLPERFQSFAVAD